MLQIDFLEEILKKCKTNGIHTAVDTAGHVPFEYFDRILPYTDLFLYDVKCLDTEKHIKYTGVSNELILSNLRRILESPKSVWVRIPIIPTFNDSEDEIKNIKNLLFSYASPEKIELLPYHAMGEHKYAALGKKVSEFSVPTEDKLNRLNKIFL
jgi:pyruvate formate lyase activating enzyme